MTISEFQEKFPQYASCHQISAVEGGWSHDFLFRLEDDHGKFLVKVAPISLWEHKAFIARLVQQCNTLPFTMSRYVSQEKSICGEWLALRLTWVEGAPLGAVLPTLPRQQQYDLGAEAGRNLAKIHQLPLPPQDRKDQADGGEDAALRSKRIEDYAKSQWRVQGDTAAIEYYRANAHLLQTRPWCYAHGDYHIGNMVYTPEKEVGVIDFDRGRAGDPLRDLVKIQAFDIEVSIPFAVGMLEGYHSGEPPLAFWAILAVYHSYMALYSIVWAVPFGERDITGMQQRLGDLLKDYANFSVVVPAWYRDYKR